MKYFVLIILFFSLSLPGIQAQPGNKDSLVIQKLLDKAKAAEENDIRLADSFINQAKLKAKKSGNQGLYAQSLFQGGIIDFNELRYDSAISNFSKAVLAYQKSGEPEKEAQAYNAAGRTYQYTGDYANSLKWLFKGLGIAKATKNNGIVSSFNIDIGLVYTELKDWDNAIKYFTHAYNIEEERKDTASIGIVLHNMADAYRGKREYRKSIACYQRAIAMHNAAGDLFDAATSTSDMANVYLADNNLDSAIYYKQKAVQFFAAHEKQEYFSDYCYAAASLGYMLVQAGHINEAAQYVEECQSCLPLLSDLIYAKSYYSFLYEFYKKKKDFPKALKNMELLNEVKDNIAVQSANFENQRIGIRYEFTQKAKEDSLQYQLKISQQETQATIYRNRMYLLLVALLALTGIAVAIVRRLRTMQENRRRRELEAMRQNIAGDLHDDIGSTLSSIQIISSMAASQCADNPPLKQSIEQITKLSDKVASGMREIVWSVNPLNDNIEAIVQQLHKLAADILGPANIPFIFIKNLTDSEIELLPQIRKDLILFFKEALNNARKYSNANQIDINIQQTETGLEIEIKDYGCGFDMETVNKGNGLNNMKRRADDMKATLSFCTKKGEGTRIGLFLPLP